MKTLERLSEEIALLLLEINAISLKPKQPFTWSSGMKSPIYCDNRITMSYPEIRNKIADGFVEWIAREYPDTGLIAGTSTAGIPHAAWVSQKLNLPMIYIRDKAKGHGKENLIEGVLKPGQKTIVIEDLISTGGSSLKAALAVNEAGGHTLAVLAIFTYELEKAAADFSQSHIPFHTLSNFTALIKAAAQSGRIQEDDLTLLRSWKLNPQGFGI